MNLSTDPKIIELWNKSMGCEHVKRACEVAITGKHRIILYGASFTGKSMFVEVLRANGCEAFETRLCPCGNYGDNSRECICKPVEIINWRKRAWKDKYGKYGIKSFISMGSICIETVRPRSLDCHTGESYELMYKRVVEAKNNPVPTELHTDSIKLLDLAYDKLNFTPSQREFLIEVAKTISRLDVRKEFADTILSHHMSEAIQYLYTDLTKMEVA